MVSLIVAWKAGQALPEWSSLAVAGNLSFHAFRHDGRDAKHEVVVFESICAEGPLCSDLPQVDGGGVASVGVRVGRGLHGRAGVRADAQRRWAVERHTSRERGDREERKHDEAGGDQRVLGVNSKRAQGDVSEAEDKSSDDPTNYGATALYGCL